MDAITLSVSKWIELQIPLFEWRQMNCFACHKLFFLKKNFSEIQVPPPYNYNF